MENKTKIQYGLGKLRLLLGSLVPDKKTNILSIMINGIDAGFSNLENMLTLHSRDNNILLTENVKALRTLTSGNGYEPNLFMPAKGNVTIDFRPSFFNKHGSNIYIAPYAKFRNQSNGLEYYFDSGNPLKLNFNNINVGLTEGRLRKVQLESTESTSNNDELHKVYLTENNIVDGSIKVVVNGRTFKEVKSLIGNTGSDVFIMKFSTRINNPIVLYINNTEINDIIDIRYRICNGIDGIIANEESVFECSDFINGDGKKIDFDDTILIKYQNGFKFAGIGTSVDTMKSQIGYNHNNGIIFDTNSYREFISKFSNVLLNDIKLHVDNKSINDIFISKKLFLHNDDSYRDAVRTDKYKFSKIEIKNFSEIINDNEYCLSSHNLFNADTTKYAFQLKLKYEDLHHQEPLKALVFAHFRTFMNNKNHTVNIDKLFNDYMIANKIIFTYVMFNEKVEKTKLVNKSNQVTDYIITNNSSLPILYGNFDIANINYEPHRLMFDMNFVV